MTAVSSAASPTLWSSEQVRRSALGSVLGLVFIAAATAGAAGRDAFDQQIAWLNLAVVGSGLAAIAQASVLLHGRRALGVARQDAVASVATTFGEPTIDSPRDRGPAGTLVQINGALRVHRPDCLLVRGKAVQPIAPTQGARRCEVCCP
jgi:hypothetical protein